MAIPGTVNVVLARISRRLPLSDTTTANELIADIDDRDPGWAVDDGVRQVTPSARRRPPSASDRARCPRDQGE